MKKPFAIALLVVAYLTFCLYERYVDRLVDPVPGKDSIKKSSFAVDTDAPEGGANVEKTTNKEPFNPETLIPQNFNISSWVSQAEKCKGLVNQTEITQTLNQAPWSDMDWQGVDGNRHAACGVSKCYLNSISDPTKGYLMATPGVFEDMNLASKIQDDLRGTLDSHVLEIPGKKPQMVALSTPMTCFVTDYFYQSSVMKFGRQKNRILEWNRMILHQVRRAPEPHVLLGNSVHKRLGFEEWATFLKQNHANATAAYQQLRVEFAKMREVLKKYPRLICDWQVLVDEHGVFYHIDTDRMFEKSCHKERIKWDQGRFREYSLPFLQMARKVAKDFVKHRGYFEDKQ